MLRRWFLPLVLLGLLATLLPPTFSVYELTGEEELDGQLAGVVHWLYSAIRPQPNLAPTAEIDHVDVPIFGVNTFLPKDGEGEAIDEIELMRSTEAEKVDQVNAVEAYRDRYAARSDDRLTALQATARKRGNTFVELMEAVKTCSLGQISHALYEVGGEYRRNM